MKKTYIIPTLKVIKIQAAHLLSGSESIATGNNYNGSDDIESRGGGFSDWDDE